MIRSTPHGHSQRRPPGSLQFGVKSGVIAPWVAETVLPQVSARMVRIRIVARKFVRPRSIGCNRCETVHEMRAGSGIKDVHLEDVFALIDQARTVSRPIREVANVGPL